MTLKLFMSLTSRLFVLNSNLNAKKCMMLSEQHFFDDCVDKEMFLQKGQIENSSPGKRVNLPRKLLRKGQ